MSSLILQRTTRSARSTQGVLFGLGTSPLYTLEDTWKDNKRQVSCIPAGTYRCVPHGWGINSPVKFKKCWQLLNVPGRDAILIHAGNTDEDTYGCILVGMSAKPDFVADSRKAMDLLRKEIGEKSFMLTVKEIVR